MSVRVHVYLRHLLIKTTVPTGDNDLKRYELELADARSILGRAVKKAVAALERFGRKGRALNVGITPSTGEVGVVVEVSKGGELDAKERERLTEMFRDRTAPDFSK